MLFLRAGSWILPIGGTSVVSVQLSIGSLVDLDTGLGLHERVAAVVPACDEGPDPFIASGR